MRACFRWKGGLNATERPSEAKSGTDDIFMKTDQAPGGNGLCLW